MIFMLSQTSLLKLEYEWIVSLTLLKVTPLSLYKGTKVFCCTDGN